MYIYNKIISVFAIWLGIAYYTHLIGGYNMQYFLEECQILLTTGSAVNKYVGWP